jgi:hypothetical protein
LIAPVAIETAEALLSASTWFWPKPNGRNVTHASTRTTQLYDQREDRVTLDEVRG